MTTAVVLGIVCGALFVMLVVALILLCCSLNMSVAEAKRIRADIIAGALKAVQKLPSEKPDAAKECGGVPPKFDEQPRRKGRYKVIVSFWWREDAAKFHDLAEFYRYASVRKCDFSPSKKMDEINRLCFIANRIADHYRHAGMIVRTVKIYRQRWYDWTFPEVQV